MGRRSVPPRQRLLDGYFSFNSGLLTINVYSLGEIYDCLMMTKFHCGLIRAFTFLVSDSYGVQQISYLRTISELMSLFRSSMFESHLTPPNIPSIRHSLPSAATSSYLSSRRSRTKHKRPSRSAESVRVGISSGENPADWYTNGRQLPMVGIRNSRIVYFHRLHK